jgi:hypothetical protein
MATNIRSRQPLPLIKAARLWRDDPDNDRNQRELAESVDALPPDPVTPTVDTAAPLVALFDHALDHHRALVAMAAAVPGARRQSGALVSVDGNDDTERVLRLWASANRFTLRDQVFTYDANHDHPHGYTIRAIRVYACDPTSFDQHRHELIVAQWPSVDVEPVAEVTATAIREALHKPHWTDEKTLSDEERAERERAEAGHA